MKIVLKRAWPLLAAAVMAIIILIFYAVTLNREHHLNIAETDLSELAEIGGDSGGKYAVDGSRLTFWPVFSPGREITVTFQSSQTVNALLLNEIGYNVTQYSACTP